jgi:O-antigen/teichoic acid export membrane protein
MNAHNALKWSFLSELSSKAVQPLVFIVLARLLTPEDYGVVASATMVISFSQIFWEAGMSKSIIQYQGDRNTAANVGFWINIFLGVFVAFILVVTSDVIAKSIFHDIRVSLVLKVMSLQVFLSAFSSIHTALLQKDMNFKSLFWVRLSTVTIPGIFSIPLALYGFGYWALIIGTLVGQLIQLFILWKISSWRPSLHFNFSIAKRLGKFGGWVALSGLLSWFYIWVDSLIVGIHLGSKELGIYRIGNTFVMMIFGFLFGPVIPVLYSYFTNIQNDTFLLKNILTKVIRILTFISIPISFLIAINSNLISIIIFDLEWNGIGIVISILALMHGFSYVVSANGEAYRAIGKPSYETIINFYSIPIYLLAYWLSIQYGLKIFLLTRFCLAFSALLMHLLLLKYIFSLSLNITLGYITKITFLCSFVYIVVEFFRYFNVLSNSLIILLFSFSMILLILLIFERVFFTFLISTKILPFLGKIKSHT